MSSLGGTASVSDSVCVGCGLCCDGTVVSYLAVRDESDLGAPLRALGVEIIAAAEPPVFELPCPAVCDGVCTIHALHRPSACTQFECKVSQSILDGELPVAEARGRIAKAFELREGVSAGRLEVSVFNDYVTEHFKIGA